MAKKTFAGGINNLIAPTAPASKQPQPKPRASAPVPASSADLVSILIRIPEELKMKLDIYCVQNRISKQAFISNLIDKSINE